jgi:ATP-dependent exoDNAse (exonuclease V) beta subunit
MLKVSDATGVCPAQSLLDAQEFARLQGVAPILLEALMQDDVQPFAARLESVWRALSGPELAQSAADLQDAESLFVLIEHLAPYGALQIDQLQERLTKLYASPDQHDRAVEIMTMHKCKGLQFETVILYGLQRSPASDRTPLLRFEQVGSRLLLGPIKARANKEQDPIAKYLAQREKRRGEFEIDRLLYVAATRAKQVLHLVADLSLATKELAVAEPAKASLLERLWPGWPKGSLGAVTARPVDQSAAKPYYRGGELIRRADFLTRAPTVGPVDLDPLLPSRPERPAFNSAFVWPAVKTYDRILGTLIHAWLDHLGRQGLTQWSEDKLQKQRKRIERQCVRAGVPAAEAACAAQEVLENLGAMLRHERGQKLLAQMGARREWALLDETGKISVLDLALQDEQGWLVVDYKTGRPSEGEAPDAFGARMMTRYANQLQSYCDRVSRLDGRPARAALYFPLNDLWVEYEP